MAEMGRPKLEINETQLKAIMRFNPTLKDVAAYFDCSEDTVERRCQEYGNCTFAEFRDKNMVHTRLSLVRKAVEKAEAGDNTMLIFSLKNLCGWRDKQEVEHTGGVKLQAQSDEDLKKRAKELAAEILGENDPQS